MRIKKHEWKWQNWTKKRPLLKKVWVEKNCCAGKVGVLTGAKRDKLTIYMTLMLSYITVSFY